MFSNDKTRISDYLLANMRRSVNFLIAAIFAWFATPVAKADWYYIIDAGIYKCPDDFPALITVDGEPQYCEAEGGPTEGGYQYYSDEEFMCSTEYLDWLEGVNRFDVWKGNAQRKIKDLPAANKGRVKLEWSRNHNTLDLGAGSFGAGGSWRHSWQYNLMEIPVVGSNQPDLYLTFPSGGTRTFAPTADHNWIDKLDATFTATADSSIITFRSSDSLTLIFTKLTSASGSAYYRIKQITTNAGDDVNLDYDAEGSLVAVSDAGGRKLQITWRSISLTRGIGKDTLISTEKVIAEVKDWAGRSVGYGYEVFSDPSSGTADIGLVNAVYSDGTMAHYTYSRLTAQGRLLLTSVDDPRYNGVARRLRYTYQTPGPGIDYGMIHQELNPITGKPYVTLGLTPGDATRRTVQYSDLRVSEYRRTPSASGSTAERIDSLGRARRTEYDLGGRISAKTDHNGVRSEFSRDALGRVKAVTRNGKSEHGVSFDQDGRVASATDRFGRTNTATRDDMGRIAQKNRPDGRTLKYVYDRNGWIASRRFEDGRAETITRDKFGRGIAITDEHGTTRNFTYDALDRVVEETDAVGRVTHYSYNELGRITESVLPDGRIHRYVYDSYARKISETDEHGRTSQFAYDELSRLIRQTDFWGRVTTLDYAEFPNGCGSCTLSPRPTRIVGPDGAVTSMLYDTEGRLLSRTTATGTSAEATTVYAYDNDDNLISVTDPLGRVTCSTYDDEHHRLTSTDPLGRVTKWTFDDRGNVISITAPWGGITRMTYDDADRLVSTTDAAGNATSHVYDNYGNRVETVDALHQVSRNRYDGRRLAATTYPDGSSQILTYDAAGRVVSTVSRDGLDTRTKYDAGDRIVAVSDSAGRTFAYAYDALGRRTSATDALGRVSAWEYDERGNVLKATRPDGAGTAYTYDTLNHVLGVIDPAGNVVRYTYDAAGNQTSLTDARGNAYRFDYDAQHRKTAMTYPDGTQEKWAYDTAGQLSSTTTRAGQIKTITYNGSGQPLTETWSPAGAAPNVTYTYNIAGQLNAMDNGNAKLTYTYDALGRLASETSDLSAIVHGLSAHTVSYRYDELGRRSNLIYPDHTKVSYAYDARGRLASIDTQGGGHTPLATYSYDANGRIEKLARDNGVATSYTYDMAGQLTDITHANGGAVLASARYTLDQLGRRAAQTREDGITETYGYDATGQLTSVDYGLASQGRESFSYDAVGNRIEVGRVANAPSLPTKYTSNALNQYTQTSIVGVATPFTYDANGNLTNDVKQAYTYDAQNRLTSVTSVSGAVSSGTQSKAEFFYDSRNRCILRKYYTLSAQGLWIMNTSDSRALTYDTAWNLLAERQFEGTQSGEYIHGQRTDEILVSNLKSQTVYPLADGLGSTVALSNEKGKIIERFCYDIYGTPRALTFNYQLADTASTYRFLYTGREWLSAITLNDHRNRYYSTDLGRWLQIDPIRFNGGDVNLVRYVGNSATNGRDNLGLLNTFTALWHYMFGSGEDESISFNDIDTSSVTPRSFTNVDNTINAITRDHCGNCFPETRNVSGSRAFATTGDEAYYLGYITINVDGSLNINHDCTWTYTGFLTASDDVYDFDMAGNAHRSLSGAALTMIGSLIPGTNFTIHMLGGHTITDSGTAP